MPRLSVSLGEERFTGDPNVCGIAGFVQISQDLKSDEFALIAKRMSDAILHRGPDSEGQWVDPSVGVALAFRRLAILDLSPSGKQPMVSHCGRYTMVMNGEIYNYQLLKSEIEKSGKFSYAFRGTSDTEVLLAAMTAWGIEEALRKTNGMFAFAVWDKETRTLTMARDRLGEKPLYYGIHGKTLLFGSELKALKAHPAFRNEIDRDVLTLFFRASYIPQPYSIYRAIKKLPPAHFVEFHSKTGTLSEPKAYWDIKTACENGVKHPFRGSEEDAVHELELLLKDSVKMRMASDVPLGAFLSGGVDSSLTAAMMQDQSETPIQTFTMGFTEKAYDESHFARKVASHLGTHHTERTVTAQDALDVIPLLPTLFDEPFSDSSQIPTYLVSKITREKVTVALSGDGGDELFGGYTRHTWGKTAWKLVDTLPDPVKQVFSSGLNLVPPASWTQFFHTLEPVLPEKFRWTNAGEKFQKLADILKSENPEDLYRTLSSRLNNPTNLVVGAKEPPTLFTNKNAWPEISDFSLKMMYLDLVTYLPDDILAKMDRASMGVSLEARVPFLDHRIVEFAWTLPLEMKIKEGKTKHLLRKLLYKYVPKELIERPKMGFSVPIDSWLKGPLKEWASSLLSPSKIKQEGFLNASLVTEKWNQHLSGERNFQHQIWDILMFEAWLEKNR